MANNDSAQGAEKPIADKVAALEVPLFLDSTVHTRRTNADGEAVHHEIPGGVLVLETELTEEEIDELTARRVIRPATVAEMEAARRRIIAKKAAAVAAAAKTAAKR